MIPGNIWRPIKALLVLAVAGGITTGGTMLIKKGKKEKDGTTKFIGGLVIFVAFLVTLLFAAAFYEIFHPPKW
jgi:hypothetical protein